MASSSQLDSEDGGSGLNDINITPLVDITLVLLIIMMVAAPTISNNEKYMKVNMPSAKGLDSRDNKKSPHFLIVDASNKMNLDGVALEEATLEVKVKQIVAAQAQPPGANGAVPHEFVIRADQNLPHGNILRIMGILKSSGATKISFAGRDKTDKS